VAAPALHPHHGPHEPVRQTPSRHPGSIRRTTSTDILRPDGLAGDLLLSGLARDVRTDADGAAEPIGHAALDVEIAFLSGREVRAVRSDPARPSLQDLVGVKAASGFRGRVAAAVPGEVADRSLLYQLLDDVPGASLIAGYAVGVAGRSNSLTLSGHRRRANVCAGFQDGGTMMVEVERGGIVPTVTGPVAPELDPSADPPGWHALPELAALGMRRRRLLDVVPGELYSVHAWFRDTYRSVAGEETIIHEYDVDARVEPDTWRIVEIAATPRVLPWIECPQAASSATRLVGATLPDLRNDVRKEFRGPSTCTHLNDQLRSLTDVLALAQAVRGPA